MRLLVNLISAKWQMCNVLSEVEYNINGTKVTLACGTNAYQHLINASAEINAKNPYDPSLGAFSQIMIILNQGLVEQIYLALSSLPAVTKFVD